MAAEGGGRLLDEFCLAPSLEYIPRGPSVPDVYRAQSTPALARSGTSFWGARSATPAAGLRQRPTSPGGTTPAIQEGDFWIGFIRDGKLKIPDLKTADSGRDHGQLTMADLHQFDVSGDRVGEVFRMFDKDEDGRITPDELRVEVMYCLYHIINDADAAELDYDCEKQAQQPPVKSPSGQSQLRASCGEPTSKRWACVEGFGLLRRQDLINRITWQCRTDDDPPSTSASLTEQEFKLLLQRLRLGELFTPSAGAFQFEEFSSQRPDCPVWVSDYSRSRVRQGRLASMPLFALALDPVCRWLFETGPVAGTTEGLGDFAGLQGTPRAGGLSEAHLGPPALGGHRGRAAATAAAPPGPAGGGGLPAPRRAPRTAGAFLDAAAAPTGLSSGATLVPRRLPRRAASAFLMEDRPTRDAAGASAPYRPRRPEDRIPGSKCMRVCKVPPGWRCTPCGPPLPPLEGPLGSGRGSKEPPSCNGASLRSMAVCAPG
ncbi:unnamed protein product [Prorocentrum cordatum]|uniref:EF-hand domain-containing protein n=1 Tax=Prorocentrum cordatum TaxID=2364126 RepID=A0ABN9Q1C9_9DINO|nr:unnamed protein product [Polarella glacialis]